MIQNIKYSERNKGICKQHAIVRDSLLLYTLSGMRIFESFSEYVFYISILIEGWKLEN
jgi:hypothetical protein